MRLGIDVGGTKIEGIALDGSREVARVRVPTPRDDYAATLDAIRLVVDRLEATAGAGGTVGVGIPGTVSPVTGLVKNANSVWLIGRDLPADLERTLGRPVRIANDANCFAVSEAVDGAACGARTVFGVIVGTGTGAGVVIGGHVLTGPHGIAGEWGHNPMPWPEPGEWPGPTCYCGHTGCIETYLSGPGLTRDFNDHSDGAVLPTGDGPARLSIATEPRPALEHDDEGNATADASASEPADRPRARSARDVVEWAARSYLPAEAALVRYEQRMARALAAVINLLDPDVIVLGGGLSNLSRLYEHVPRYWSGYVFACGPGEAVRTRLVRAMHGDSSGVRGAAWLWNDV